MVWRSTCRRSPFWVCTSSKSNFVTPSILGARMTVEPLLVIISLGFWLWLWGPVGAFLAVPLLLVIKVVVLRLLR